MTQLRYLLKREFQLFITNKTILSVFFIGPLIYALLLGFTYQKGKITDIPVMVINQDQSPMSYQVIEMLEDNKTIKVLNYVNEPYNLKEEIIKTQASATIIIPKRFEANILQKKYPEINVYFNNSNVLTSNFASKAIQLTLGTFSAGAEIKSFQRKGMNFNQAKENIESFKTNYISLFNTTGNYLLFMWPAIMAVVLQQVILLAMAVTFSEEFKRDSFVRDFTGKHKYPILVMFIKCLPVWLFSYLNIFVFYLCALYFRIPIPDNIINFFLLTSAFIIATTNLGVFFSILIPDALKATQVLMVIASPAFIISGFTWPSNAMPVFIENFSKIIPLTPYLEAMKIMVIEKGPNYLTLKFFWHLFILGLVFFLLGWMVLRIKIKKIFKDLNIS
ncbi:ABC transporter permease [Flavobacterium columnare]|uniref:ABC-2 type transporter n=2 Tax=Flavobacterium columnare TaxID=996 RepID=G8X6H2_FLACA|nr:ABC transporter permease [Flavobacterium columnare]AEW84864.1 ABC-2 type transporter [Flavobacterium columnare ATCC 49512]AMO20197.1 ABC transporter permease [Flavobacterium columnare]ANO49415.1 ABC-2 type transporter [Flavobacterium columnare]APT22619.1 ABC transporter permease [Flavobacterium columnare]AUX18148.1 ABC transporter permease [Flavobacterium columnare]